MNHISDSLDEHWSTFKVNYYEKCFPWILNIYLDLIRLNLKSLTTWLKTLIARQYSLWGLLWSWPTTKILPVQRDNELQSLLLPKIYRVASVATSSKRPTTASTIKMTVKPLSTTSKSAITTPSTNSAKSSTKIKPSSSTSRPSSSKPSTTKPIASSVKN